MLVIKSYSCVPRDPASVTERGTPGYLEYLGYPGYPGEPREPQGALGSTWEPRGTQGYPGYPRIPLGTHWYPFGLMRPAAIFDTFDAFDNL